ncbi:hypothetical protein [Amycolatopsis anabasis]|uniref:hypothetical protein n=1 Tax=Amycolatopsis anabasis TaxID=1840409 RepID=UPI00131D803D|nr:hypothetical protein [Amycolatopsis anabasis]
MVDVHDGLAAEGFAVPLRLHNLLLALAGRLDDSALSEAREQVARSRLDEAAELVAGALIAGRLPVQTAEQRELALVLELSRSDATLADQLTIDDADPGVAHRFSGDNQPEQGLAEALDRTLQVLPDLRSVHAVWRNTPAGSVPGPLPQRVVLVEIGPEGNPPAVAYRVDAALRRAGIRSVVEVTGPSAQRTGYHDAAGASANPVWLAGTNGSPVSPPALTSVGDKKPPREKAGRHTAETPVAKGPEPAPEPPPAKGDPAPEARIESAPPQPDAEARAEKTSDMSSAEVAQLREALAEEPEKGKAIASITPAEVVEIPDLDLDDPQLSERDRRLLRELHAELAERERAEAAQVRLNGSGRGSEPPQVRWVDGFSGA